ncbi:MAG TPA: TonB-dependent receptor, partial [Bryobacteraceae bacterium]|nr:TonB-dependent receptor [Bryobacteraceae bacterium]
MFRRFSFLCDPLAILLFAIAPIPVCAADLTLTGRVVDENGAPVSGAHITVHRDAASWEATTAPNGTFSVTLPRPGDFVVDVERQGFYPLKNDALHLETSQEVTLTIASVREVFQSVDVSETPSPVDITQSSNTETLTATEVNDVPYANSHSFRNALQMMPGVVMDSSGGLHINGSSENQVSYLLNGFNIANPVTGQLQTIFAIEAVRSVDLSSGRYSPQYGDGSAGTLAINTENGTDHFRYFATDFFPGASFQEGLHLGNWYPRFGFSGPIVRGRAWFSDDFDIQYNETVITGLPSGQNTRSGIAFGNLLHTQVNLTKSNILFSDFLVNYDDEGRVGLGALSPVSTTSTVDTREYLFSVKDEAYLGRGFLVELGYAHNAFSNDQTPQGPGLFVLSPLGQSGNYFVNSNQTASADEGMINTFFPQLQWLGAHQFELGASADRRLENGDFHRTGYQVLGDTGQLLSETLFPTPALFHVSDTEFATYFLDTWRMSSRFQLNLGVRSDQDQVISAWALSPRLGFSWSPFSNNRTRVSGGYAITHDQVTLNMLSLPLDQVAETT